MTRPTQAVRLCVGLLALAACAPEGPSSVSENTADVSTGGDGATAAPIFTEVAHSTGLDFGHFIGASGDFFFAEIMGSGGALLDFDGDGDLDVYLLQGSMLGDKLLSEALPPRTHPPRNRLFRNELIPTGELRFFDVTDSAGVGHGGYAMGAAVGDYDNDGDPDLFVTNFGPNVLYRNDGDGRFTDVTPTAGVDDERWNTSAAFLDYDHDGDLDLYVVSYVSFSERHNKRCLSPAGRRDYCSPASYEPLTDRLYRNEEHDRFTDVTVPSGIGLAEGSGLGVIGADFDRDGRVDIYVANDKLPNHLWRNLGGGRFEEIALMSGAALNSDGAAEASMGVTAGDMDGDGDEDLFMTHLSGESNTLYLNDGSGSFVDGTDGAGLGYAGRSSTGFGSAWFDYDGDGLLDLFIANGAVTVETSQVAHEAFPYLQANKLFRNEGEGRFADVSREAGPGLDLLETSRGAAFGDIDNDGDVDVLVTNGNGPVRLLRNEVGNQRGWLRLRLQGTVSNRDGAGARVALLRAGQPTLWRHAHTDGSYLSASDIRVHFGLGDHPSIEGIVVVWPGGRIEIWRDVIANRELVLREGTGEKWELSES